LSDKITATRITPERIDGIIEKSEYFGPIGGRLTICVLTLRNGFMVVGQSSCAATENYVEQLGRTLSYDDAREKIWALEGYALRTQLALKPGD
jgi:hypothetical protein